MLEEGTLMRCETKVGAMLVLDIFTFPPACSRFNIAYVSSYHQWSLAPVTLWNPALLALSRRGCLRPP